VAARTHPSQKRYRPELKAQTVRIMVEMIAETGKRQGLVGWFAAGWGNSWGSRCGNLASGADAARHRPTAPRWSGTLATGERRPTYDYEPQGRGFDSLRGYHIAPDNEGAGRSDRRLLFASGGVTRGVTGSSRPSRNRSFRALRWLSGAVRREGAAFAGAAVEGGELRRRR
jgi:hypothetical protein